VTGVLLPATARAFTLSDFITVLANTLTAHADTSAAPASTTPSDNVQTMDFPQPATNIDPSPTSTPSLTIAGDSAVVPEDGPSGTSADIQKKTQNGSISVYVVRSGDTLSTIAQLFGVTPGTILSANDLTASSKLQVGEQLVILPITGITYTVKKGDTLESIAKKYGGDAADIGTYNGIDDSSLAAGIDIIIPDGEVTAPAPTAKKSTSSSAPAQKVVASSKILQGQYASGNEIPMANNPAEPARGVGPVGTTAEIDYYTSPLASFVQTQNIHGYNAVDLAAPKGTSIMAAAAGEVIIAKSGGYNGGYGSYVVITHSNGSQTLYGHMSVVEATVGEEVAQGQVIGKVGATGDATGPHVHFEIRNGIRNPF
jgi:murein DD-endopeptidase MepM/ murein hydrolase activator NlpD